MQAGFYEHRDALRRRILLEAQRYAVEHGLGTICHRSLDQMNTNLAEVAGELLMFGADVWPEGVEETAVASNVVELRRAFTPQPKPVEEVAAPVQRSPLPFPFARLAACLAAGVIAIPALTYGPQAIAVVAMDVLNDLHDQVEASVYYATRDETRHRLVIAPDGTVHEVTVLMKAGDPFVVWRLEEKPKQVAFEDVEERILEIGGQAPVWALTSGQAILGAEAEIHRHEDGTVHVHEKEEDAAF